MPAPSRKAVAPHVPLLSPSLDPYTRTPQPYHLPAQEKELTYMTKEEKKREAKPPFQSALAEKAYYPSLIPRSELPYLHLIALAGSENTLKCQIDYGREKETLTTFLTLVRNSTDLWTRFESGDTALSAEENKVRAVVNLGSEIDRQVSLDLTGYQATMELPGNQSENKTQVFLTLDWAVPVKRHIFRVRGWGDWAGLKNERNYDSLAVGGEIAVEWRKSPVSLGFSGQWEKLRGENDIPEKNQTHVWIRDKAIVLNKNLVLSGQLGFKGIAGIPNQPGEIVPRLMITWKPDQNTKIGLLGEKKFYLSRFSDLYLANDYVLPNENLGPVNLWNYELSVEYRPSPQLTFSLTGFSRAGKEVIWNWKEDEVKSEPDTVKIQSQGVKFNAVYHFTKNFEVEGSFVSQNTTNKEKIGWVVPHAPSSSGEAWLRWKRGNWLVEVGGESTGERYYQEDSLNTLKAGWRSRFKIARKIGDVQAFGQMEWNDYSLWPGYSLPKNRFTLGVDIKLF